MTATVPGAVMSATEAQDACAPSFEIEYGTGPLIVSMPHSGTGLSADAAARMRDDARGLPDTDRGIPELYDFVAAGDPESIPGSATKIRAHCSRYMIDLNRDPSGDSLYPGRATTELVPTVRFDGEPIWLEGKAPTATEIEERRVRWFDPWHAQLGELLEATRARHGFAVLWDAHSIRSRVPRLFQGRLPDLNLGTNEGRSCHPQVQAAAAAAMSTQSSFTSVVNGRFTGGWITRHHGRPDRGIHALQMELAMAAWMDEQEPWTPDPDRTTALRETLMSMMNAAVEAASALHDGTDR